MSQRGGEQQDSLQHMLRDNNNYDPPDRLTELPNVGASPEYDPTDFSETDWTQGAGWPTAGTRITEEDADVVVVDSDQLVNALTNASKGDVIWMPTFADIDITGLRRITVGAKNVTLASGRTAGEKGARLYSTEPLEEGTRLAFVIDKKGFRATGFRLEGPQKQWMEDRFQEDAYSYDIRVPNTGISVQADGVEIDNVVGRGWGHAAIEIGREGPVKKTHIHHCDLVDNPQDGLGYGVTVFRGNPLIQYNYFDYNRHSVAGDGYKECSYICRYNLFGPNATGHVIDMHSAIENDSDGGYQAGKRLSIHHNEIMASQHTHAGHHVPAIKVRDVPIQGGEVVENLFAHPPGLFSETGPGESGSAIYQRLADGRGQPESFTDGKLEVRGNFSSDKPVTEALGLPKTLTGTRDTNVNQ